MQNQIKIALIKRGCFVVQSEFKVTLWQHSCCQVRTVIYLLCGQESHFRHRGLILSRNTVWSKPETMGYTVSVIRGDGWYKQQLKESRTNLWRRQQGTIEADSSASTWRSHVQSPALLVLVWFRKWKRADRLKTLPRLYSPATQPDTEWVPLRKPLMGEDT